MDKLTVKEIALLKKIALDEFQPLNGACPKVFQDTGVIFAFVLETKAEGGTFASLQKKGLVGFEKDKESDVLWLTEAGFQAYKENC